MAFFESLPILLLVVILLLQIARRLQIAYPTILAAAGVIVAALPGAPDIRLDPQLALALFIAPALLATADRADSRRRDPHGGGGGLRRMDVRRPAAGRRPTR